MTLTVELTRHYEEDGYIVVENLFSREEVDRLGRRSDEVGGVTEENGCVRVIAGRHKLGPQPHSDVWMVGTRKDMKIPDRLIDRGRERLITMKAGSVSFHHSLLMHASAANHSAAFRRGYAFHYMSAQSRWTGDPAEKPEYLLLRGREYSGCV